ncbi:Rpn family recombination-promoting nuclease/putative transposase [Hominiventricola filiformis]|uniref:Rpn family recombination-promoting nuclease/putative transposase n=1 Tax=Hominiventricola filiformis TaxID=2885352 RepID=A0AAE3AA60_9FIRM|nr:Rpn family recombination-promoting nuclease/putative transposase [Hominiventricola filiformis]MBR9945247.1 Rpn family recombination-promoting nuclease/putative transposase [Clostridiaceae bacterium Marseille-Q4145]MCC2127439.1 Rpn family recombination-promoting nuclease/putative transposase [Hominiventricola filiformis]
MKTKAKDNFLMSPKVDYCFKELLAYSEIRKGFIAAILNKDPEEIAETTLMPTILSKDTEDGKYGILDVRVRMKNGSQMDLEMQVAPFEFWNNRVIFYLSKMYAEQVKEGDKYKNLKPCIQVSILNFNLFHEDRTCFREIAFCDLTTKQKYTDLLEIYVLELKKLPPEQKEEPLIIKWMRFLAAESREDFEKMAGEDNYINEAYEVLQKLSADERKRLEYEARQKAIRDYDSQMSSSREEGIRIGEDRLNHLYEKLMRDHRSDDLVKAISDKVYREKLYQEYGL